MNSKEWICKCVNPTMLKSSAFLNKIYWSQCFVTFNDGLTFLTVTSYHSVFLTNIMYPQLQSDLSKKPEKVIISVSVGGGYKRGTCTPLRLNNGHVAVLAPAPAQFSIFFGQNAKYSPDAKIRRDSRIPQFSQNLLRHRIQRDRCDVRNVERVDRVPCRREFGRLGPERQTSCIFSASSPFLAFPLKPRI